MTTKPEFGLILKYHCYCGPSYVQVIGNASQIQCLNCHRRFLVPTEPQLATVKEIEDVLRPIMWESTHLAEDMQSSPRQSSSLRAQDLDSLAKAVQAQRSLLDKIDKLLTALKLRLSREEDSLAATKPI